MISAFLMSVPLNYPFNQQTAPLALRNAVKQRLDASGGEAEAAIIRQAIAGEQSAYASLVRRYNRMVYGLVFQMLGNHEDALEVTQDTFLKAFRFISSFRGESRFSTWLYHIARTCAINRLRRARRETVALDAPESTVDQMYSPLANGYEAVLASERSEQLLAAFKMLRPEDGLVLQLFYMQEQSLEEICTIMDWTMSNAKSRLCRARQRLRVVLAGHFSEAFSDWI